MNLLEIVQAAAGEMGLPIPVSVVGNTTQQVVQLYSLLNGLGRELAQDYDWQGLTKEYRFYTEYSSQSGDTVSGTYTITGLSDTSSLTEDWQVTGTGIPQDCYIVSVDSGSQVTLNQKTTATGTATMAFAKVKYPMASDYSRKVNRTDWDKTRHWELLGPATPQQWEWLKSGFIAVGPRIQYIIQGDKFQIWPMVAAEEYLGYEYISSSWAYSSGGAAQTKFEADTDTCIFRDSIMVAGLKVKYFEVKQFDASNFRAEFSRAFNGAWGADKGAPTLRMSGSPTNILINLSNVPDSGYGG